MVDCYELFPRLLIMLFELKSDRMIQANMGNNINLPFLFHYTISYQTVNFVNDFPPDNDLKI
jgi:hypothetical protein